MESYFDIIFFYVPRVHTLKWEIDDVIRKMKNVKFWKYEIAKLMIAVIFGNDILDVLFNRLDAIALQVEWPLQNSQKCPTLYLRDRWP